MNGIPSEARRGEAGFTLMEIMAALTVFLVGVVGVISLLTSGTHLHSSSLRLEAAGDLVDEIVLLAEQQIQEAEKDPDTGLPTAMSGLLPIPGREGVFYSWEVRSGEEGPARSADDPPRQDVTGLPYLLTVEISWQEGGKLRSIESHRVLHELESQTRIVRRRR